MSAIATKDTERASLASANEEIRTSPPATLTPRPTPEEFLAALDLNPPQGLARAYVDTLITKALGEENLAFLKTKAHDEGFPVQISRTSSFSPRP